jgi:hypothetical protein
VIVELGKIRTQVLVLGLGFFIVNVYVSNKVLGCQEELQTNKKTSIQ